MRSMLATAALAVAGAGTALAQAAPAAPARPTAADTAAIVQVTTNVFDAMRKRDTTMLRAAFAPGAQLTTVGVARDGSPRVSFEKPDAFVQAVGQPSPVVWDERTYHTEVRIDGNLATVWMEYDFYAGDQFSHCGVDAFQLAKHADGWKIIALADTRQREGCPKR
ncbi:MAG TPA: nuclear transport factor 2 family protein [Gemmatimonadales bacterium]